MIKTIQSKEVLLPWYTIEILEDGMISIIVDENYGFATKEEIKFLIRDLQKTLKMDEEEKIQSKSNLNK